MKTMKNFCKEFNIKALMLVEFLLDNKDETELFLQKIYLIKEAIKCHIDNCDTCKVEEVNKEEKN